MNSLVSIIIPVYNVEQYLNRCVESAINQTYNNLEIILVDDGSPDNCPQICDDWAKKDNRIKVIHKENGGLSSARNAGINNMTGEYVYFIDSDDEINPSTIEQMFKVAKEDNCDMVMGRYFRIFENEKDAGTQPEFTDEIKYFDEDGFWNYYYLCYTEKKSEIAVNMIISCNKLIKSSVFDDLLFDIGKKHEDEFIIHKMVSRCKKIAFIDTYFYSYYQVENSIMQTKQFNPSLDAYEAYCDRIEHFSNSSKDYTGNAFVRAFGGFSFNILNYRKSNPQFSKELKALYKRAYISAKPYIKKMGIYRNIYYSSILYSPLFFRILRKINTIIRK